MCAGVASAARRKLVGMLCKFSGTEMRCLPPLVVCQNFQGSPFSSNALKIWEVRNFPLDFWGQVRNIPRADFPPAAKALYPPGYKLAPPPPPTHTKKQVQRTHTDAPRKRKRPHGRVPMSTRTPASRCASRTPTPEADLLTGRIHVQCGAPPPFDVPECLPDSRPPPPPPPHLSLPEIPVSLDPRTPPPPPPAPHRRW